MPVIDGIDGVGSVLVISPHADDEVLGAGGLIAKFTKADVPVKVLFLVVDGFHHYGVEGEVTLQERVKEIDIVSSLLGFEYEIVYKGMDLIEKLDTIPKGELVDRFEDEFNRKSPDLVLLPHGDDYDQDHATCYKAAFAAARPIPQELSKYFPKKILTYEMPKLAWGEKPFQPNFYWNITAEIDSKLGAIEAYRTQLREPPHVRSLENIRALAYLRGSEIGVEYAEAFHTLRWVG